MKSERIETDCSIVSLKIGIALRGRNTGVLGVRGADHRGQPLVVDDILNDADDDLARLLEHQLVVPGRIDLGQIERDSIVLANEERVNADEAEIVACARLAGQKALRAAARFGGGERREGLGGREALRRSQLALLPGAQERVSVGVDAVDLGAVDVGRQVVELLSCGF